MYKDPKGKFVRATLGDGTTMQGKYVGLKAYGWGATCSQGFVEHPESKWLIPVTLVRSLELVEPNIEGKLYTLIAKTRFDGGPIEYYELCPQ